METMTDWQEPYIEGEKYAGVIGPGIVTSLGKVGRAAAPKVSRHIKDTLRKALDILRQHPNDPEAVTRLTKGAAHSGPDEFPFMVLPYGPETIRPLPEIPAAGIPLRDVWNPSGIRKHIPGAIDQTRIMPDPRHQLGSTIDDVSAATRPDTVGNNLVDPTGTFTVTLHPHQLRHPEASRQVLAHELSHITSEMTGPGVPYLRGSGADHIMDITKRSKSPEQALLAKHLREGTLRLSDLNAEGQRYIRPEFITADPSDFATIQDMTDLIFKLRHEPIAYRHYHNTFGEALARHIQRNPNRPLSQVLPWKEADWDAAKGMEASVRDRLHGSIGDVAPGTSLSYYSDLPMLLHILRETPP